MKIRVFYNPAQNAKNSRSFSPSAGKPALVAKSFMEIGLAEIVGDFEPATIEDFSLAHDLDHVRAILSGERPNGFGNTSEEVAASLPWTTGSMLAAGRYALENNTVAASLTSGFHHAGYTYSNGFCTFNGLMVTARRLLQSGATRVGILDLDAHLGDGTEDIIRHFDLHGHIVHYTFGRDRRSLKQGEWLQTLPQALERFKTCDAILYQAGADPHEDDPLGGHLSTEVMRFRDRLVFQFCKTNGIPVAWNLAGGYQDPIEKVIDLHVNTLVECAKVYAPKTEDSVVAPPPRREL